MSEHKRPTVIAGNWKMNLNWDEAIDLAYRVAGLEINPATLVILGAPYLYLNKIAGVIADTASVHVAAQNCHQEESGAYTGEISAGMLSSIGADYVILGHSERRQYFGETDDLLYHKTEVALRHRLKVIFCCGETLDQRQAGKHFDVVTKQLEQALFQFRPETFEHIMIAYEPVWAIGTGQTATPEQAQEMHAHIRSIFRARYPNVAEELIILYGGSMKPANAAELLAQPDIDGGLIGGASLKFDDFKAIIDLA